MAWRTIEGVAVLMDPDRGVLSTLNAAGTLVWCGADGRTPIGALGERIAAEFEVSPNVARRDTERFVTELCRRGLIVVGEESEQ